MEDELPYNDNTLKHFKEPNFPYVKGVRNMSMKWMSKGYKNNGNYFVSPDGKEALVITLPRVWKNGRMESIFLAKSTFYSPETKLLTMGHELGHVQHMLSGSHRSR